jgi:hypothetical protein
LKTEFRPLEHLETHQIAIQNLNVQDDPLTVRVVAPAEAVRVNVPFAGQSSVQNP